MAKKKIENMMPKSCLADAFNQTAGYVHKESEERQKESRGAASGCKAGMTRHTYILTYETIDKIKSISGYFGMSEVELVRKMLSDQIDMLEKKYGKEISVSKKLV